MPDRNTDFTMRRLHNIRIFSTFGRYEFVGNVRSHLQHSEAYQHIKRVNHMDTKKNGIDRKPFVKPELKRHSDLPVITAGSIDLRPR